MIVTSAELEEISLLAGQLKTEHVIEVLQSLMVREQALIEQMPDDQDCKQIALHNIACLASAAARLQTEKDVSELKTENPG